MSSHNFSWVENQMSTTSDISIFISRLVCLYLKSHLKSAKNCLLIVHSQSE